MSFITQGKTNWKFLLIVVILAVIVGGGILAYQYWSVPKYESVTTISEGKSEIEIIGTIKLIGNEPMTQLAIETDDGNVFGLIGNIENLRNFQNKRFKVKGYLTGRTPPSFSTEKSIDVISSERITTENETADWQTYRNEQYGLTFSFQYPPPYEIVSEREQKENQIDVFRVVFQAPNEYVENFYLWGVSIYKPKIKEGVKLIDVAPSLVPENWFCEQSIEISENIPTIACRQKEENGKSQGGSPRQFYFISPQGFLFEVEYFYINEGLIKQILSTFKFLE